MKIHVIKLKDISEEKGSVTVWMTLLSMIMLAFVLVAIEGVRIINAHNISHNSANLAALSVMADYDLDIYDNYGLYMISKDIDDMVYTEYSKSTLVSDITMTDVKIYDIKYLDNACLEKQICYNDEFYNYLLEHFSSYKKPYVKGYMERKYAYELEYLIGGKEKDNDNIKIIQEKLKDIYKADVIDELDMTTTEYELYVIEFLEQVDKNELLERIREIIISNINNTYDKNLDLNKMIVGMSIKSKYRIENHLIKIGFVGKIFNKINNKYEIDIVKESITFDRII